jgi:hypothetical protein
MPNAPTEHELQAFFEEVWQLAERANATEDWQLGPYLFALAEEIAAWRNELREGQTLEDH